MIVVLCEHAKSNIYVVCGDIQHIETIINFVTLLLHFMQPFSLSLSCQFFQYLWTIKESTKCTIFSSFDTTVECLIRSVPDKWGEILIVRGVWGDLGKENSKKGDTRSKMIVQTIGVVLTRIIACQLITLLHHFYKVWDINKVKIVTWPESWEHFDAGVNCKNRVFCSS